MKRIYVLPVLALALLHCAIGVQASSNRCTRLVAPEQVYKNASEIFIARVVKAGLASRKGLNAVRIRIAWKRTETIKGKHSKTGVSWGLRPVYFNCGIDIRVGETYLFITDKDNYLLAGSVNMDTSPSFLYKTLLKNFRKLHDRQRSGLPR